MTLQALNVTTTYQNVVISGDSAVWNEKNPSIKIATGVTSPDISEVEILFPSSLENKIFVKDGATLWYKVDSGTDTLYIDNDLTAGLGTDGGAPVVVTWQEVYNSSAGAQFFQQIIGEWFTIKNNIGTNAYSFETQSNGDDNALRLNNDFGANEIIKQNLNTTFAPRIIDFDSFASVNSILQQIIFGRRTSETLNVSSGTESARYLYSLFEGSAGSLVDYFELNSDLKQVISHKEMVLNDNLNALTGYQSYARQIQVSASQNLDNTIIGKVAINSTANNVVITIPNAETFSINAEFEILRTSTGTFTVQGQAGITFNGLLGGGISLPQAFDRAVIRKIGADEWTGIEYSSTAGNLTQQIVYDSSPDGNINLSAGKHIGYTSTNAGIYDPVMTTVQLVSIPNPPTALRAFTNDNLRTYINIGTPLVPQFRAFSYLNDITFQNCYDNNTSFDISSDTGLGFTSTGQSRIYYSIFNDAAVNNQIVSTKETFSYNDDLIPVLRRSSSDVIRQRSNLTAPNLVDSSSWEKWILENGVEVKYFESDGGSRINYSHKDLQVNNGIFTILKTTSSQPIFRTNIQFNGATVAYQHDMRTNAADGTPKVIDNERVSVSDTTNANYSTTSTFKGWSSNIQVDYLSYRGLDSELAVFKNLKTENVDTPTPVYTVGTFSQSGKNSVNAQIPFFSISSRALIYTAGSETASVSFKVYESGVMSDYIVLTGVAPEGKVLLKRNAEVPRDIFFNDTVTTTNTVGLIKNIIAHEAFSANSILKASTTAGRVETVKQTDPTTTISICSSITASSGIGDTVRVKGLETAFVIVSSPVTPGQPLVYSGSADGQLTPGAASSAIAVSMDTKGAGQAALVAYRK